MHLHTQYNAVITFCKHSSNENESNFILQLLRMLQAMQLDYVYITLHDYSVCAHVISVSKFRYILYEGIMYE